MLVELTRRGHEISVIDLCLKKNSLSEFYQKLLLENDIQYISREELLPIGFRSIIKNIDRAEPLLKPVRFEEVSYGRKKVLPLLGFVIKNFNTIVFHLFRSGIFNFLKLLPSPKRHLSALLNGCDNILWDHRSPTNFYFEKFIVHYLAEFTGLIYLIPHAPHMRDPITELYLPITGKLNQNYRYLLPLKWSDNREAYGEFKAKFIFSGYPGFDASWISHVSEKQDGKVWKSADNNASIQ